MGESILTDADAPTLGERTTGNLTALFRAMSSLKSGEYRPDGAVGRHHAFPTNPMFKGAWGTRIEGDVDTVIDETIDWFKGRGAPYFFWWTDVATRPPDLGQRLEARGLLSMEGQQKALASGIIQTAAGAPAMGLELAQANVDLVNQAPANLEIVEVETGRQLRDFKQVFVEAYQIPEWAGQAWVDATEAFGVGRSPWRMFVGYLEGEPVATNMLFCGAGVASVYAVATLPKAQRKGIGAAITLKPLLDARDKGYRFAVLFSTEEGQPVYRRLGFADTGWRINRYLWRAS